MCSGGSNENIIWKFELEFTEIVNSHWVIEFGGDFGRGVGIFIDG